jgi:hypothetical protein
MAGCAASEMDVNPSQSGTILDNQTKLKIHTLCYQPPLELTETGKSNGAANTKGQIALS